MRFFAVTQFLFYFFFKFSLKNIIHKRPEKEKRDLINIKKIAF